MSVGRGGGQITKPLDGDGDSIVRIRGDLRADTVVIDAQADSSNASKEYTFEAGDLWDFLDAFDTELMAIVVGGGVHMEFGDTAAGYFQLRWAKGRATFDNDPARSPGEAKIYPEQAGSMHEYYHPETTVQNAGNGVTVPNAFQPTDPNWFLEAFDDGDQLGLLVQVDGAATGNWSARLTLEYVIAERV